MFLLSQVFVSLIAILHIWILILEMFLWQKPVGLKTFKNTKAQAKATAVLAANQGLYNGFLVAGLFWGLLASAPQAFTIKLFFLSCVMIAGIYGGITASRRILVIQALPALIGILLVTLSCH